MKKTTSLVMVLMMVSVVFWMYHTSQAQLAMDGSARGQSSSLTAMVSGTAADTPKIGVVNVGKVLVQCKENLAREADFKARGEKITAELKSLADQADKISQELENVLEPMSDQYNAKLKQWFELKAKVTALQDYQKKAITAETQAWTEALYAKLLSAIKFTAQQQGITLVINKDEMSMKGHNLQDVYTIIRSRQVLYNAPNIDLTDTVLEVLDKAYLQEKAKSGSK